MKSEESNREPFGDFVDYLLSAFSQTMAISCATALYTPQRLPVGN